MRINNTESFDNISWCILALIGTEGLLIYITSTKVDVSAKALEILSIRLVSSSSMACHSSKHWLFQSSRSRACIQVVCNQKFNAKGISPLSGYGMSQANGIKPFGPMNKKQSHDTPIRSVSHLTSSLRGLETHCTNNQMHAYIQVHTKQKQFFNNLPYLI